MTNRTEKNKRMETTSQREGREKTAKEVNENCESKDEEEKERKKSCQSLYLQHNFSI